MKLREISLLVCLFVMATVSAQDIDAPVYPERVLLKPMTKAEMKVDKIKKLKITPQNLVDVKEAAKTYMKLPGIEGDRSDILVIIDGKKVENKEYQTLDPKSIESITILKNKSAAMDVNVTKNNPALLELASKKYNSAIVITTKKKEVSKN